jgi:hypothetical protein
MAIDEGKLNAFLGRAEAGEVRLRQTPFNTVLEARP